MPVPASLVYSSALQQAWTHPEGDSWVILRPILNQQEAFVPKFWPPFLDSLLRKLRAHGLISCISKALAPVQHLSQKDRDSALRACGTLLQRQQQQRCWT